MSELSRSMKKEPRITAAEARELAASSTQAAGDSFGDFRCPHCGSAKGTWFDRSFALDHEGNEVPDESFPDRCLDCGKNVDAPTSRDRSAEVCCDCNASLAPDRYFKWLRDSDRKPLCDKCSASYDLL